MLTAEQIAVIAARALEDKKAKDVKVLKTREQTILADYFVICTAKSNKQVKALAEMLEEKLEERGEKPNHEDGMRDGKWAVLDYASVIVHIFNDETRMFYCLEKLWTDGGNVEKYVGKD